MRVFKPVPPPAPQSKIDIDPQKLQAIRDGLWMAVNVPGGTGITARIDGRDVAGKTGSAQVISTPDGWPRAPTRTCATTAGSSSSRRATIRDRRRRVRRAPRIRGGNAARISHHACR